MLNNLALAYQHGRDTARAIELHLKSLYTQEELNDLPGIISSLNNLGNIYTNDGTYAKAEPFCAELFN